MTVDNVIQILNKIPKGKWEKVVSVLGVPWPLMKKKYSTDNEKNHAIADYYVNCHLQAEWEHLTRRLYMEDEFALARESKSFMSTGKSFHCTTIIVTTCITVVSWVSAHGRLSIIRDFGLHGCLRGI